MSTLKFFTHVSTNQSAAIPVPESPQSPVSCTFCFCSCSSQWIFKLVAGLTCRLAFFLHLWFKRFTYVPNTCLSLEEILFYSMFLFRLDNTDHQGGVVNEMLVLQLSNMFFLCSNHFSLQQPTMKNGKSCHMPVLGVTALLILVLKSKSIAKPSILSQHNLLIPLLAQSVKISL